MENLCVNNIPLFLGNIEFNVVNKYLNVVGPLECCWTVGMLLDRWNVVGRVECCWTGGMLDRSGIGFNHDVSHYDLALKLVKV